VATRLGGFVKRHPTGTALGGLVAASLYSPEDKTLKG